jgi:butyryl-CoA dehydrogenase
MPIALSESEEQIYQNALAYGRQAFLPWAEQWDTEGTFPLTAFRKAGEDGFLGIGVSQDRGGKGYSFVESALVYQGIARSCMPLGFAIACHNNMSYELQFFPVTQDDRALFANLVSGKEILAFALTEENAGSDPLSSISVARKTTGGYVVKGKKTWVTNGSEASKIFLIAKSEDVSDKEMILFLVDNPTPGLSISKNHKKLGSRLLSTVDMVFEDCFIPEERVMSRKGYADALWAVMIGRLFVAALAVGLCEEALHITMEFLAERKQFNKKILLNQGIQWELAELSARLEAAKWLSLRAAYLMDSKQKPVRESSMAKLVCSDLAVEITSRCLELFGARGYSDEFPIERYFRDAKLLQIVDGTTEIQKLVLGKIIAEKYVSR